MTVFDPFHSEKDEIGINIPFMDFIQNNEWVLIKKISVMDQPLQENSIGHKDNLRLFFDEGLHGDVIPHRVSFRNLFA